MNHEQIFACFFSDAHWSFKRLKLDSPLISDLLWLESRIYIYVYINIGWICPDKTSISDTRNSRFFNQNPYHRTAKTIWRRLVLGFSIKFYSMHVPFFSFGLNKLVLCLRIYVYPIFFHLYFWIYWEKTKAIGLSRGPNYPKSLYGVRVQLFLMLTNIPLSWLRLLHRWDRRVYRLHTDCPPMRNVNPFQWISWNINLCYSIINFLNFLKH